MSVPVDQATRDLVSRDGLTQTLFVEAGAGTGKTTQLVDRIANLVLVEDIRLANIAAITFTEAAAAELQARIRVKFEKRAAETTDPVEQARCARGAGRRRPGRVVDVARFRQSVAERVRRRGRPPATRARARRGVVAARARGSLGAVRRRVVRRPGQRRGVVARRAGRHRLRAAVPGPRHAEGRRRRAQRQLGPARRRRRPPTAAAASRRTSPRSTRPWPRSAPCRGSAPTATTSSTDVCSTSSFPR